MKSTILLIAFLSIYLISVKAFIITQCNDPQKAAYLSFNFLSKRDTITNLFNETNSQMIRYDFAYTDPHSNKIYNISSMHPQLYYNEHYQIDEFMDDHKSKVRMGKIEYAFSFNFQIIRNGASINKGWAHGRKQADDTYFIKSLLLNEASLQWQLNEIVPIKVTSNVPLDNVVSSPNITDEDKIILQQMINDKVGERGLKQKIFASFNAYYSQNLKKHLNNEHLFNNTKVTYVYKNLTLEYIHLARDPKLVNNPGSTQGLISHFTFELQGRQQNCSKLPPDFQAKQGGAQQLIAMQTLKESFKAAIQHGVFDVTLDSKWEAKTFQFFMGDLSNVVKNGVKYLPRQPIYGTGKFNKNKSFNLIFAKKSISQIEVKFPYTITLTSQSQELLKIDFILSATVKLAPLDSTLQVLTTQLTSAFEQYNAINPDFEVTNQALAKQYINSVLSELIGVNTFGTGWPIVSRRFPSAIVEDEYIIINDYSEL